MLLILVLRRLALSGDGLLYIVKTSGVWSLNFTPGLQVHVTLGLQSAFLYLHAVVFISANPERRATWQSRSLRLMKADEMTKLWAPDEIYDYQGNVIDVGLCEFVAVKNNQFPLIISIYKNF